MSARSTGRVAALITTQRQAQRPRLRLAAAAGAVVSVAAVGLLGLSGWFITGAAFAGAAGGLAVQSFNYLTPSAIIRLLAILRTGARYIERVAGHEAALKALARLRPQLFHALASAPPERALALSSGDASARLVQDVDAVQTVFVRLSAPWALGAGVAASVVLAALATPLAALVLLGAMGLTWGGAAVIAHRRAEPAGRAAQAAVARLKDSLSALEAVAPELKAYALDGWAAQQVAEAAAVRDRALIDQAQAGGWMAAWQAGVTGLAVAAVVPATHGATLPLTALAVLAAVMGLESLAGLIGALHQNGAAAEAQDRLDDLLPDEAPRVRAAPRDKTMRLAALATDLSPPARLGLFGASGAGKTTLIERLIGLRTAPEGEARLGGVDIADLAPDARRALFAYAAQDVRLMDGTIRQNLILAGPADEGAMWRALDDAALAQRVRADPLGLDAPVGVNGERLSGGERRRLGLARAYLRDAPWLVLDEPTEGLDAATEAQVLAALTRRLSERGQGLILISHRLAPMAACHIRLRIECVDADGRVRMTRQVEPAPADA
ncbi:ATP-binding cassette domain-containing protein [Brevundimonas sp.]|uniref:amino acid ABC transporter ATP-binding/permease protein n=1 Tax=Brevundimonas sp. TaxID=1871086 RepID=UPI001AD03E65|nr:ATP-binding cassette domain-containing protein [Brevundimonas sp.]MBN9465473.1 ATP-binding cassette domain-containing protein [Brevundimonas sp.]